MNRNGMTCVAQVQQQMEQQLHDKNRMKICFEK